MGCGRMRGPGGRGPPRRGAAGAGVPWSGPSGSNTGPIWSWRQTVGVGTEVKHGVKVRYEVACAFRVAHPSSTIQSGSGATISCIRQS